MDNPLILIVMPLYNAAPYVKKAVNSILTQTYSNFRLLVINDGSTDTSRQEVDSVQDDRVVIWDQDNLGPGASMNRALQYADENKIPFIARMDADDISAPTRLEVQLYLLENNPSIAACSSNCYYIDNSTEAIIGSSTVPLSSNYIKWEISNGLRGMIQGATLFRTNSLHEIGGYRLQFKNAEETDLFLRLIERYELSNSKEFLYKIRLSNDSLSMQDVHRNVQYHFYAVECSKNRKANKPEISFELFLRNMNRRVERRILHEEYVLRLWRSYLVNRDYLSLIWVSLLDPRRLVARILRRI